MPIVPPPPPRGFSVPPPPLVYANVNGVDFDGWLGASERMLSEVMRREPQVIAKIYGTLSPALGWNLLVAVMRNYNVTMRWVHVIPRHLRIELVPA